MKNQLAYSVLAAMMLLSSLILTISVTAEGMEVGYISFTSNRRGNYDIYMIDRHGENLQRLIGGSADELHGRWSPNGRFLAYASNENAAFYDIYVMDMRNKRRWQLTNHPANDTTPTWSPDGQWVAFVSNRNGEYRIYRTDIEGEKLSQLTKGGEDCCPSWSPDGKWIAFNTLQPDKFVYLSVMSPDGRKPRKLMRSAERGHHTAKTDNLRILTLSTVNNLLSPVPGIPVFDNETQSAELMLSTSETLARAGGFAVGSGTFYAEYKRELFRWRSGDPEWTNIGLLDTGENLGNKLDTGFKLAVSGNTVYVGKRDGRLFQSLDGGDSWKDITSSLPLRFSYFNEIVFVESTAYVATNTGVLTSQNGESWHVLTDGMGTRIVVDRFAVDGMTVYGAGDTGVYRSDTRGRWKRISPSVPDKVISLIISKDRLYIATQQHGIFHRPLGEEYRNEFSQR